jgi:hypothetical protein
MYNNKNKIISIIQARIVGLEQELAKYRDAFSF